MQNYILEAYLLSDETIIIDFDKFKRGGRLFIIGFAGSGKSSIGYSLWHKYKMNVCTLDDAWAKDGEPYKDAKGVWKNFVANADNMMFDMLNNKQRCRVVEGIQLLYPPLEQYALPIMMREACVIMGKSAIKSAFDAARRNKKEYGMSFKGSFKAVFKTNRQMLKHIDDFRKKRIKAAKTVEPFKLF